MRKEFKTILTDNEEHGDKIEILVKENYAEILTEEDKAYMKHLTQCLRIFAKATKLMNFPLYAKTMKQAFSTANTQGKK